MIPFGLGAVQSVPDERDWPIAQLYETSAITPSTPPASFTVAKLPPVYDQGQTPECVAYSDAAEQASFDLADPGQGHNYLWDFETFFHWIHGGVNGAQVRTALDVRLHRGYPLLPRGSGNSAAAHRIAAYYAVSKSQLAIQQAIQSFGVAIIATPWFNSWFTPDARGVLPPADYQVGGHAIAAIGWTPAGLLLRNSWGSAWGVGGNCTMPWSTVLHSVWEVWKAVDVIDPKGA